jgi:glycerophosphoryl diester phosphodiesterase
MHGRSLAALAACTLACGTPPTSSPTPDPPQRPAPSLAACALNPECRWPLVVAHRGLGGGAPENTVAGVQSAKAAGADAIEVDVRPTADGALVLMHDSDAERTTDASTKFPGRTAVDGLTLEEVRTLVVDDPACTDENADADPARCRVGEFVPLLEAARGELLVMIDFKGGTPESVAAAVRDTDALDTAWFFDSSEDNLARAQAEAPGIAVMPRAQSEASARDLLERLAPPLLHTDPGYQRAAADAARETGTKTFLNVLATADIGFAAGSDSGYADAAFVIEQTLDDGVMLVQTNFSSELRALIDERLRR